VDPNGVETGPALGTAIVGPNGRVRVTLSRTLVVGEHVRLKDTTFGIRGDFPQVINARPSVMNVSPSTGPFSGGTSIWMRGTGFLGTTAVTFDGVPGTALTVISDDALRVMSPASSDRTSTIRFTSPAGTAVVSSFTYRPGFASLYRSSALSSWTAGSGWACGALAIPSAAAPVSSDRGGCHYAGSAPGWGALTSPIIGVPLQSVGPLTLRVQHRGDFGSDGDGVVVFAMLGSARFALVPRDEATTRVHAGSCTGSGAGRTCSSDPPSAGLAGYARSTAPLSWRTSYFDLPAHFDGGGAVRVEFVASNMSATAGSTYDLSSVELLPRGNDPGDPTRSNWTTLLSVDTSCSGTLVPPFTCGTSPVSGALGSVFRYHNAPLPTSTGSVSWPITLAGLSGRTITAVVRHRVDMTAGTTVGTGGARVRACCGGSCSVVSPTSGYPASPPAITFAFTDEGPDAALWMVDEFDLSSFGGNTGSCSLQLMGVGAVTASQAGWLVDSVRVRWR